MDVMGGVFLTDGTKVSVVTGIDDHSWFCVCAKVVVRATAKPLCDALVEALRRHGVPDQMHVGPSAQSSTHPWTDAWNNAVMSADSQSTAERRRRSRCGVRL